MAEPKNCMNELNSKINEKNFKINKEMARNYVDEASPPKLRTANFNSK